ncbi:hypothetical protein DL764_000538 [Monosporascus ibericus]|uniref:Uncharacterized protein n=1 Tax=Monosporascus ibericus TaxID=155417 RepID=A0A4Q4TVP4_9PEZI|nr:hypothetical protein DL764_000538 [Monosporascus ibericus]
MAPAKQTNHWTAREEAAKASSPGAELLMHGSICAQLLSGARGLLSVQSRMAWTHPVRLRRRLPTRSLVSPCPMLGPASELLGPRDWYYDGNDGWLEAQIMLNYTRHIARNMKEGDGWWRMLTEESRRAANTKTVLGKSWEAGFLPPGAVPNDGFSDGVFITLPALLIAYAMFATIGAAIVLNRPRAFSLS